MIITSAFRGRHVIERQLPCACPHPTWRRPGFSSGCSRITGRGRGGPGCRPLGTSGGFGFPSTRHLNGASQAEPHSAPCRDRTQPSPPEHLLFGFNSQRLTPGGFGFWREERDRRVGASSWDSVTSRAELNSGNMMLCVSGAV